MGRWIYRVASVLPFLLVVFRSIPALARVGGGEHYQGTDSPSDDSGGGDGLGALFEVLIYLVFRHPKIGVPLLIVVGVAVWWTKRKTPTATARRAAQHLEAERRTSVTGRDVTGWVNTLKLKDPQFDLLPLLDRVKALFVQVQEAWFRRDLDSLRPYVSDATYERLKAQQDLMAAQGLRDAIADISVLDVQIVGLDQSEWFDTVRIRVRAQMRDVDAPATASDEQALAMARRAPVEAFTEVWSFVRKPGAQTKAGMSQGKCPSCGAPYPGGATNRCEYCQAVVNSGNYDWTLAEITQGSEHIRHHAVVDGLLQARESDPALNLEMLEDRASLLFWKWIEAQSQQKAGVMAKLASGAFLAALDAELQGLQQKRRRKVFLECAVGAVIVRVFQQRGGFDRAHVEVRWSAKMGIGPADQPPPALPTVPQRWIFTLIRRAGAKTRTDNGMSTHRCPNCNAPLSDSVTPTCDFCNAELSGGALDWVVDSAATFDAWNAAENARFQAG